MEEQEEPFLIFLQYSGKCYETYARDLKKTEVPCRQGDIHHEEVKNSDTVFETTNREESEEWSYL